MNIFVVDLQEGDLVTAGGFFAGPDSTYQVVEKLERREGKVKISWGGNNTSIFPDSHVVTIRERQ